jgi:tetratricopeptide (TPR) repeat protein
MKIGFIIIFTFIINTGSCQPSNLGQEQAEEMFKKKRYGEVWPYYKDRLRSDSTNAEWNYRMGLCYLNSRSQKEKAIDLLKKADLSYSKQNAVPSTSYKQLAEAFYLAGAFEDAGNNYEKYRKAILAEKKATPESMQWIDQEIEMCKMAEEIKELKELANCYQDHKCNNPVRIPAKLSSISKVNRKTPAAIRFFPEKELFEESARMEPTIIKTSNKETDTSSYPVETTLASSVDGQIILIYKNEEGRGSVYLTALKGNEWTASENLNKMIGNYGGWESNEFISADGKVMYFTSDRTGGFGGKDIYKCNRTSEGEWGRAVNLGSKINSAADELAPFIHPDGITLYFSSNRKRPRGFDNFTSVCNENGEWSEPVSVGYPASKNKASAVSSLNSKDVKPIFEKENYRITFVSPKKIPISVIRGKITKDGNKNSAGIDLIVADNETAETSAIYQVDDKTGRYVCIIPAGKNNNITYEAEGYLFQSENINHPKEANFYNFYHPIKLSPLEEGAKVKLNNIFFEYNKAVLTKASTIELKRIADLLNKYPKMEIEFSQSISKRTTDIEKKLIRARLESLVNAISQMGIDKKRMSVNVHRKRKREQPENGLGIPEATIITLN